MKLAGPVFLVRTRCFLRAATCACSSLTWACNCWSISAICRMLGSPPTMVVFASLSSTVIPFEERDLTISAVADEAKARYGVRVAPITVVGNQFFYGTFDQQPPKIEALLNCSTANVEQQRAMTAG